MEDEELEVGQQTNSEMDQVLRLCKKIEIQKRLFCFEFKENRLAQYLIISHDNGSSSIFIPSNGISCFLDEIDCLLSSGLGKQLKQDDYECFSKEKEVKIDGKVFSFGIGHNRWGHYLKVWEASASDNNTSSIIVPNGNNGWELFKTTLAEIYKTSKLLCPPRQRQCVSVESSSIDAKVDSITSESTENSTESKSNGEPSQNRKGSMGESRMMRAGLKRFFFDLGSNRRGHFLKISEVMGINRSSIIIPLSSMQQFHEMVGHFLKCSGESFSSSNLKHGGSSIHISKELDVVEEHKHSA